MEAKIGIDVGNYDTKTQHTTVPSSFKSYDQKNLMVEEYVYYNNMYYTPTKERNNQQLDKTVNGYCLVMSLFAIAKEMIFQIRQNNPGISDSDVQKEINKYDEVKLGIGAPVGFYSSIADKTVDYYNKHWKKGFSFTYMTANTCYEFNLRLSSCAAFPQDFASVAFNDTIKTAKNFRAYYIFGIGGGTADVIPVDGGVPQIDKCRTIEKGSTVMYEEIIKTIQHETGRTMDYTSVEDVLLNRPTLIDEQRKSRIKAIAADFVNKLVDDFVHMGLRLSDFPSVFVGGGALLMREHLANNPAFVMTEFVEDVNANAKYYAEFI